MWQVLVLTSGERAYDLYAAVLYAPIALTIGVWPYSSPSLRVQNIVKAENEVEPRIAEGKESRDNLA